VVAYRQTYHGHVRDELACRALKEKSLASSVKVLVNDIEGLREAWDNLDTCFDHPEKYILEAIDPIVKFRSYRAYDNRAMREFYPLQRSAMMEARKVELLCHLINDQTLPGILAKMPSGRLEAVGQGKTHMDWRHGGGCLWTFVDQKWSNALNIAAAEPTGWGQGSSSSRA
jgi:hypothetical protein